MRRTITSPEMMSGCRDHLAVVWWLFPGVGDISGASTPQPKIPSLDGPGTAASFFGGGGQGDTSFCWGCSGRGHCLVGGTGLGPGAALHGSVLWHRVGTWWQVGCCGDSHAVCDKDLVLGVEAAPLGEGGQDRGISALHKAFWGSWSGGLGPGCDIQCVTPRANLGPPRQEQPGFSPGPGELAAKTPFFPGLFLTRKVVI